LHKKNLARFILVYTEELLHN